VILASVATSEEMKELVVVLFVMTASVFIRLEIVALIASKFVAKRLVEDELVITEEEAKILLTKRLRNRFTEVPRE
jgi:hypothetical protein